MSKAFTKEHEGDVDDLEPEVATPAVPAGTKNYMTPAGYQRLKGELLHLLDVERPEVTRTVAWAASNGDRSENADYIYGKKRLREIDRRIRFLTKRLDDAEVVDPAQRDTDQIFFGATVTILEADGSEATYSIVGLDEVDPMRGRISWISPLARALLKAREGDTVTVRSPGGMREVEVVSVRYEALD